jgi:hypothetical protein
LLRRDRRDRPGSGQASVSCLCSSNATRPARSSTAARVPTSGLYDRIAV